MEALQILSQTAIPAQIADTATKFRYICPSVARWRCVKTTQRIIISASDSFSRVLGLYKFVRMYLLYHAIGARPV